MTKFYLDEIYGIGNMFDDVGRSASKEQFLTVPIDAFKPSGVHDRPTVPPKFEKTTRPLTAWQQFFKNRILKRQDTFMTVPPGAGKTDPIIQSWLEQFIDAHERGIDKQSKEFPRLLFIGRTKQLSGEVFGQTIRDEAIEPLIRNERYWRYFVTSSIDNNNPNSVNQMYDKINTDILGISAGSIRTPYYSNTYKIKPVYISTPSVGSGSPLLNLIRSYGDYFNTIIIDESQDYMIKPGELYQSKSDEEMFNLYLDIVRLAARPGRCGVHLLSGTTNIQTAEELIGDLNYCYKRNFEMPKTVKNINDPNDPGHMFFSRDYNLMNKDNPVGGQTVYNPNTGNYDIPLSNKFAANRSNITVIGNDQMATPEQKKRLIIDIVSGNRKNSVMIIFSVNREAKTGILRLLQDVNKILPVRFNVNLFDVTKYNPRKNPIRQDMVYTDITGISQHGEYIRAKDSSGKPIYSKVNINDIDPVEFLKYFDVDKAESGSGDKFFSDYPNENNIVYQGILRGIGIMIGKSDNRHKEIVQQLFRDGKLILLLATDSLGIGANILAKDIYITSMTKPPMFNNLNDSSLIQLANRVGRRPDVIPYATVQVNSQDRDHVAAAMSSDPSTFNQPLNQEALKKGLRRTCNVDNFIRKFFNL